MTNPEHTDAPERIWIVGDKHEEFWFPGPLKDADREWALGEYIRVDLARPRVKPLEWVTGGFEHDADLIDSTETYQIQDGIFWYAAEVHGTQCGTNDAAKAAAQADYERRILSALVTMEDG